MSISLKKGRPFGIVEGGPLNGKILYIRTDTDKLKLDKELISNLNKHSESLFPDEDKRHQNKLVAMLHEYIKLNMEPDDDYLKEAYHNAMELFKKDSRNELVLDEGKIRPIPNPDVDREVIYVAGPAGSGKSYWVADYGSQYKIMKPKNDIIVFSRLNEDPVIDKLKPVRIVIDPHNAGQEEDNPPEYEEDDEPEDDDEITLEKLVTGQNYLKFLKNSLCIFDDTDTIRNPIQLDEINKLKADLMEAGRKAKIYMCITSHQIADYKKTKTVLNECNAIVIFPASGSVYAIRRVLKEYIGLSNNDIDKILKLPSRWVTIYRTAPQFCVWESGCAMLGKD